jgi:antirestriction protein ArdC
MCCQGKKFRTLDAFYATCVHEIAHSTGHKSRLDRNLISGGNQEEYAKEELRAELTSMFIAQDWGLAFDEKHYQSHEAYLQSWAKVLKDDPNELYRAASKAQEMVDYIEKNMLLKGMELPSDRVKDELKQTAPQKDELQYAKTKGVLSCRHKTKKMSSSQEAGTKAVTMAM